MQWDDSPGRLLIAQALTFTRFGNGAKKSLANEVTNPGAMRQKKTQEDTEEV